MGNKDRAEKLLISDNEVFAEMFNKLIFNDERIIDPDHLSERDPVSLLNIFNDEHRQFFLERTRDVLKHAFIRYDDHFTCLLLGIENQSKPDQAMPLRVLLYDALNYARQSEEERKRIRRKRKDEGSSSDKNSMNAPMKDDASIEKDQRSLSSSEWLSGFSRKTVITPIITLVVYYGTERYDGPLSLHEMMDEKTVEGFKDLIEDYKLHLISVHDLDDEYLRSFKTEIGIAMEFAKYADDKKRLLSYTEDERFLSLSNSTVALINAMTSSNFRIDENGKGRTNMCKGIEDIKRDAWNEATEIATIRTREEEAVKYGRIIDEVRIGTRKEEATRYSNAFVDFLVSKGQSREEAERDVKMILSKNNSDYSA